MRDLKMDELEVVSGGGWEPNPDPRQDPWRNPNPGNSIGLSVWGLQESPDSQAPSAPDTTEPTYGPGDLICFPSLTQGDGSKNGAQICEPIDDPSRDPAPTPTIPYALPGTTWT